MVRICAGVLYKALLFRCIGDNSFLKNWFINTHLEVKNRFPQVIQEHFVKEGSSLAFSSVHE